MGFGEPHEMLQLSVVREFGRFFRAQFVGFGAGQQIGDTGAGFR